MPTYQYSCTECGHFFEIVQSFSDDSLSVCPECGGRLRKVFNAVGVVFKGSGFYRTDSRGQQKSNDSSPSGNGSSGSGEKSSGTKETSSSSASSTSGSGSSTSSSGSSSGSASGKASGGASTS